MVLTGDMLEARSDTRYLFIDGRPVPLETKHTQLYNTFKDRPGPPRFPVPSAAVTVKSTGVMGGQDTWCGISPPWGMGTTDVCTLQGVVVP